MEKILDTVIIEGVEFQIIHKPETIYAGFRAEADNGDDNNSPLNTYELFKDNKQNIRGSLTPNVMICLSMLYKEANHGHNVRRSLMHCQEVPDDQQPEGITVVKSPESILIKVKASDEAWTLTKKTTGEDNPQWHMAPLFGLCDRLFCNAERGYTPTPDFSDTYEIEYYHDDGTKYAAISVMKR